jgi:hypothetical protein
MEKRLPRANPPIAEVVIAFQPRQFGRSHYGIEPGRVALFRLGDPRVRLFDCDDGATWVAWRIAPLEQQLKWMLNVRKLLIRECGISKFHVEGVFRQCPEFRAMRLEQRLRREKRRRKRRASLGTR